MQIPALNIPRVVIIGGGFAGLHLAKNLSGKNFQVVLVDKHNYHTFQPLLYQVATAGLEPDAIAYPLRKAFNNKQNFYFRMANVNRIDPAAKTIHSNIGDLSYDYLVFATGSRTNYFGLTNIEQLSMPMKSIVEALNLRSLILENYEEALLAKNEKEQNYLTNYVIVGGGPTGVELAGALCELKKHVLPKDYPELDINKMTINLVEAGPQLLGGMSDESSEHAKKSLEKMGVNVMLDCMVSDYDGTTAFIKDGKELPAKTLIWTAGVEGGTVNGIHEESIKGGRIVVDTQNKVKGYDDIYAIGDVAAMITDDLPKGHPMLAPVAVQQGKHLAKNLKLLQSGKTMKPFRYKDNGTMATIGRNRAVADLNKLKFQGIAAWFLWVFVHLMQLVGFRNKLITLVNWWWSYLNYDRGIRLIIRPFKRKSKHSVKRVNVMEEQEE